MRPLNWQRRLGGLLGALLAASLINDVAPAQAATATSAPTVSATISTQSATAGQTLKVTGSASQRPGCTRDVILMRHEGGWQQQQVTTASNSGRYAFTITTSQPGTFAYSVQASGCGQPSAWGLVMHLAVSPPTKTPDQLAQESAQYRLDLIAAMNQYRASNGLLAVPDSNDCLNARVQAYAETHPTGHNNASGDARACGLRGATQILGPGGTVAWLVQQWAADSAHIDTLRGTFCRVESVGVSEDSTGTFWVVVDGGVS